MSTDKGYIKLYRDVREHWIWDSSATFDDFHAWTDLIMSANHADKEAIFNNSKIIIERGSFITSIRKLADRWGWGRNRVSDFLKLLQDENMIVHVRASHFTRISIVNYSVYQDQNSKKRATARATDRATDRATSRAVSRAPNSASPEPQVEHKQYIEKNSEGIGIKNNETTPDDQSDWEPEDYDYEGNGWTQW